ncbi:DUF6567 family protein [Patiriisocius sp. Uisw_047]|jgi:hypothetical protein|uniref:DUF6567 family protein n=1 Tax=Patiriisocius sp. Uisw_047 TaxID=3230969 RepID=UPI0039ED3EDB
MKKIIFILVISAVFTSCKTSSLYSGGYQQQNQTQTILSSANFNVLGSFTGTASEKIMTGNISKKQGIISQAKEKMLEKAKKAGIELIGSRALVNVSVDLIETKNRISATMSAEIIEFK